MAGNNSGPDFHIKYGPKSSIDLNTKPPKAPGTIYVAIDPDPDNNNNSHDAIAYVDIGNKRYEINKDLSDTVVAQGSTLNTLSRQVKDINDELDALPNNYVTIVGDQTITGEKTFDADVIMNKGKKLVFDNNDKDYYIYVNGDGDLMFEQDGVSGGGSSIGTFDEIFDKIYPVGSIYMSMTATLPFEFGTWERIAQGRTLIGVNEDDASFNAKGKTGGVKSVTLTEAQMPSHTHTGPSHTHTGPSHTHTGPSHTHTGPSHTHSFTTGNPSANHTHSVGITTGTVSAGHVHWVADHTHTLGADYDGGGGSSRWTVHHNGGASNAGGTRMNMAASGGHNTGGISANHTHWVGGNTGTVSAWHTHSGTTGAAGTGATGAAGTGATGAAGTGKTGASGTGETGSAGSGNAHTNMPPYLTCYIWQRVA